MLSLYEGVGFGVGVRDLKIEELQSEGLSTDSTALVFPTVDMTRDAQDTINFTQHPHQYVQYPQALKQCANITVQFLDGTQFLIHIFLTDTSKLHFVCCSFYTKLNMFQTVCFIMSDFITFLLMFL
jgi:hypothetical protein